MNRCTAFNKNNKRCRSLTNNNSLFCCKSHEPINNNIIEDGCFICMEKIINSKEIIYFKCKHAFHKECYNEWLKFSTYKTSICILCRKSINEPKVVKQRRESKYCSVDKLEKIKNILNL